MQKFVEFGTILFWGYMTDTFISMCLKWTCKYSSKHIKITEGMITLDRDDVLVFTWM